MTKKHLFLLLFKNIADQKVIFEYDISKLVSCDNFYLLSKSVII